MRPRRTVESTGVLELAGGNEDNDLWYQSLRAAAGGHIFRTVWEPTPAEREAIAAGSNLALHIWGTQHPPVTLLVTDVTLGKAKPT